MEFPRLSSSRRSFLESATSRYHHALWDSPAFDYLLERGFTVEVAKHFRLGFVAEPLEGHEAYRGMVAIPYIAPTGSVAMRFRNLGDGAKYLQESGSRSPLFNVRDLHRVEAYVAICEGEFDAITLSGLCGIPAVGIPGVDSWNKNADVWRRLFEDWSRVFVVMDPDDAGQKIAKTIMKHVGSDATNVMLPADANDTYKSHGADFIRSKMGL